MTFRVREAGIDTGGECIAFLRADDALCRCLGLSGIDRVEIRVGTRRVLGVLDLVSDDWLGEGVVGLSAHAFRSLGVPGGTEADVRPAEPPASVDAVRRKMSGGRLGASDLASIVQDVVDSRYSKVELTAFVVAATMAPLDDGEVHDLVAAMVATGERLRFGSRVVADKHCIGGVPGNRTTPIVTAIAVAAGLVMPKTSSRAITSAAGTADAMECLMDVELSGDQLRTVVAETGGCLAWGGALALAPADDRFIRVEKPLEIDSESLMIASILAKKVAAGATHVVLDIPVGPETKVRDASQGIALGQRFERIGASFGLHVRPTLTDGSRPVGRGIGPALEAGDVLAVLERGPGAPRDLRTRALFLAGQLLEHCSVAAPGRGVEHATGLLDSGSALGAFEKIRRAQGRRDLSRADLPSHVVRATSSGVVLAVSNRAVARAARLAGAPAEPSAGIVLRCDVGERVVEGGVLMEVHAASEDALTFALEHLRSHPPVTVARRTDVKEVVP